MWVCAICGQRNLPGSFICVNCRFDMEDSDVFESYGYGIEHADDDNDLL